MPLLPITTAQRIEVTIREKPQKKKLGELEPMYSHLEVQNAQLPIDRLVFAPNSNQLVQGGSLCPLCEYFLHFVQDALAAPKNEDDIKRVVSSTCGRLPSSLREECHSFVETYGDAIIALLIQEIDPSQVCPLLLICSKHKQDVEVFAPKTIVHEPQNVIIKSKNSGTDKCPLCLFAVQAAEEAIKSDKSAVI